MKYNYSKIANLLEKETNLEIIEVKEDRILVEGNSDKLSRFGLEEKQNEVVVVNQDLLLSRWLENYEPINFK